MRKHDFVNLFEQYPEIIGSMGGEFNSHEFILELARRNQRSYIEALNDYAQAPAPFRRVHGILSRHLHSFPELIQYAGMINCNNIFTIKNECAQWRKVRPD